MPDQWKSDKMSPTTACVNPENFLELMMRHMIGGVITEVGQDEDGFLWFQFIRGGVVFRCEVSQDEEGNGPGFLFGLPNPYDYYASEGEKR